MATQTKIKPKAKPKLKVERGTLTAAEQKKLDSVLGNVLTSFKLSKTNAEATHKQLARFGRKHLLNKLGRRGTGPHAHGFNAGQRKAITTAVNAAFGIKAPVRKPFGIKAPVRKLRVAGTAGPLAGTKRDPLKGGPLKSGKRSTAQLATAQTARAQGGQPIPGTQVLRQGS